MARTDRRDLYETLGIGRAAEASEIQSAYRQRAKATHPDAGGDREEFEAVQKARAVLLDPVRRARYDETGEDEVGPDDILADAMEILMILLDRVIQSDVDFAQADVVVALQDSIRAQERQVLGELRKVEAKAKRTDDLAKRFRTRTGDSVLRRALEARAREFRAAKLGAERRLKVLERALEILGEHSFDFEAATPAPRSFAKR